jgi:iron donor protein CyaY
METSHFERLAEQKLQSLAERIEAVDTHSLLEVEYLSGVLTVTLPGNRQYVLNRHRVTQQLWWSSPVSGAKYFSLSPEGVWLDKEQKELEHTLGVELQALTGVTL